MKKHQDCCITLLLLTPCHHRPVSVIENWHAQNGDTATVSCGRVGGPGRFPLSAPLRVPSVVVRSIDTTSQVLNTMVFKTWSLRRRAVGSQPAENVANWQQNLVVQSAATIAPKVHTMVGKKYQIGSIASITTEHRSDHRAAE